MKTLMAVLLAGTAFVSTANAATTSGFGVYSLEYGTLGNPTPYGTIKVTDQGNGVAKVEENVSPNFILNNGNAGVLAPLTFNLAGNGSINVASVLAPFSVSALASVSNPPFGSFTDAIDGNCGQRCQF